MLLAEKRVQPSARARSHSWSPKLVKIQKKSGLLKNLLMVANNTPTIMEGVRNRFRCSATSLDPNWEPPEFTVAKIQPASTQWSKKCVWAARNADKLCHKHLKAQREATVNKVIPEEFQKALTKIEQKLEINRKNRTIQARLKKPRTQLTYVVQSDGTAAVGQEMTNTIQQFNSIHFQQDCSNGSSAASDSKFVNGLHPFWTPGQVVNRNIEAIFSCTFE